MLRGPARWKAILLLGCALLVPGCQSASAPRPSSDSATSASWQRQAARLDMLALTDEYVAALRSACENVLPSPGSQLPPSGARAQLDCIRTQVLDSFGQGTEAERYCTEDSLLPFLKCVLRGASASRVFEAVGEDPVSAVDWTDPSQTLQTALRMLVVSAVTACGRDQSCAADHMGSALKLDPVAVDRCSGLSDDQVGCIAHEMMMDQVRTALLYVG